ncbi:MAG: metal-dependent hydrolase [Atopobiaceae bacterium]
MTGKTHIAAGAATALWVASGFATNIASAIAGASAGAASAWTNSGQTFVLPGQSPALAGVAVCLLAILGGAVGGLLPDADVNTSQASKELRRGWAILAVAVAAVFAVDFFARTQVAEHLWATISSVGMSQVAGIAILVAACACGRVSGHRGFTHSIVALCLCTVAVSLVFSPLCSYFFAGYLSHLVLDVLNHQGERLLWPLPVEARLGLCKSGGVVDTIILILSICAIALQVRAMIG